VARSTAPPDDDRAKVCEPPRYPRVDPVIEARGLARDPARQPDRVPVDVYPSRGRDGTKDPRPRLEVVRRRLGPVAMASWENDAVSRRRGRRSACVRRPRPQPHGVRVSQATASPYPWPRPGPRRRRKTSSGGRSLVHHVPRGRYTIDGNAIGLRAGSRPDSSLNNWINAGITLGGSQTFSTVIVGGAVDLAT